MFISESVLKLVNCVIKRFWEILIWNDTWSYTQKPCHSSAPSVTWHFEVHTIWIAIRNATKKILEQTYPEDLTVVQNVIRLFPWLITSKNTKPSIPKKCPFLAIYARNHIDWKAPWGHTKKSTLKVLLAPFVENHFQTQNFLNITWKNKISKNARKQLSSQE